MTRYSNCHQDIGHIVITVERRVHGPSLVRQVIPHIKIRSLGGHADIERLDSRTGNARLRHHNGCLRITVPCHLAHHWIVTIEESGSVWRQRLDHLVLRCSNIFHAAESFQVHRTHRHDHAHLRLDKLADEGIFTDEISICFYNEIFVTYIFRQDIINYPADTEQCVVTFRRHQDTGTTLQDVM